MYYLEPNSIMSLSTEWIARNRSRCYTSYLAFLEIVSGITKENYTRQRSALTKVVRSRIKVDLRMPQQILAQAFGINYGYDTRTKPFMNTVDFIVYSDSYDQVYERTIEKSRYWSLRSLQKADGQVSIPEIEVVKEHQKKLVEQFSPEVLKSYKVLFRDRKEIDNIGDRGVFVDLLEKTFQLEVQQNAGAALRLFKDKIRGEIDIQLLLKNYKGSLDVHFYLHAYRFWKNVILQNDPGVNDSYDTDHLMYVGDKNDKIVTDDGKLYLDLKYLYPSQVLRKSDLLNLHPLDQGFSV